MVSDIDPYPAGVRSGARCGCSGALNLIDQALQIRLSTTARQFGHDNAISFFTARAQTTALPADFLKFWLPDFA